MSCNIKQNTLFQSNTESSIDLIITNSKFSFMKTKSFGTDLIITSDVYYSLSRISKVQTLKLMPPNLNSVHKKQFK